ncbi:MAG: hypothetical protein AAF559_12865 [Pseudomonadota bacterium]
MGSIYQWAVVVGGFWVICSIVAVIPTAFVWPRQWFWLKAIGAGTFPPVLAVMLLSEDGEAGIIFEIPLWYHALCALLGSLAAAGVLTLINWVIGKFSKGDEADYDPL